MENAVATKWRLGGREVCISHTGSGDPELDHYYIRIAWSDKLGLELAKYFVGNQGAEDASNLVKRIKMAGVINPDMWEKVYYPSRNWATYRHFD